MHALLVPQDASLKPTITLTTDFGTADTFVAQMKGVIAWIAPDVRVIDGTHEVPPQDILAGALALEALVDAFAGGTIHLAVVDPGVGTDRAAVAVKTERFILVGPDNGLFTLVLERYPPIAIVSLTNPEYRRTPVSPTFHGRDIFALVAAHLASGTHIHKFGEPVTTLVNLNIPQPETSPNGLIAIVLATDGFGNLITNLTRDRYDEWLAGIHRQSAEIRVNKHVIGPIRQTFADVKPGELVVYFGSSGRLELAVRNGSARKVLGETKILSVHLKPV
jgi:S-adenosyl-L-methionine hydrolase (adenosine-forming)